MVSTAPSSPSSQELGKKASSVPFLDQEQYNTVSGPVYSHVSVTWDPWITAGDTGVNVTVSLSTPIRQK